MLSQREAVASNALCEPDIDLHESCHADVAVIELDVI